GCDGTSTPAIPSIATSSLGQFRSDASTTISTGGTTSENTVVFKGTPMSSSSDQLVLQIEVQDANTSFTNTPTTSTAASVISANVASTTITNLGAGSYHWQARVLDSDTGATSTWKWFGANATGTDFIVSVPSGYEISDGSIKALYHFNS